MQRSIAMNLVNKNQVRARIVRAGSASAYDVFINHRGTDTKRTVATLLYDHLFRQRIRPFLDNKSMKAGDKLFDKIDNAVGGCKIGVAVFSPRYCDSYFCLHELALMMSLKKKVIPIFCDVKPSQLSIVDDGTMSPEDVRRFALALEEAKYTVGLEFDSYKGNWSDVVKNAANIVIDSLAEIEDDERLIHNNNFSFYKTPPFAAPKSA
ncbi:probable 2' cyclic ADP-D-ribose synthase BdTIR [Salvia miltiorrhiza]|uniref:probable 2' cyclic ADP-D-ribose synthase BdTIR n=1 Tax=Salvia miltiorrhiza TaxID=226208 RepID=UPI0025AB74F8|nr:probable 2' cyclic ADP-D-ribose synthase BdTIR [Salvia miltiorrhiza]